ncbi:hypothetical protein [Streptomyces flaveolus]|uniref:hypothetical protein n=1 Tax=Streptomyces flaveolus TaxID=67297 RepID=UPI0033D12EC7
MSVVEALKDLRELAVLDQTGEDLGHVADAGIADDKPVRALGSFVWIGWSLVWVCC